jgi:chromosome segregation ATPase
METMMSTVSEQAAATQSSLQSLLAHQELQRLQEQRTGLSTRLNQHQTQLEEARRNRNDLILNKVMNNTNQVVVSALEPLVEESNAHIARIEGQMEELRQEQSQLVAAQQQRDDRAPASNNLSVRANPRPAGVENPSPQALDMDAQLD